MKEKNYYGRLEIEILSYFHDRVSRLFDISVYSNPDGVWMYYLHTKQKSKKKKKRYPRDEALYNIIRDNHFFLYFYYMPLAVHAIVGNKSLWKGNGRPPKKLTDMLICLLIWRKFPSLDARDAKSFLKFLLFYRIIDIEVPCFKTLCNYNNNPIIRRYLDELITITSKPLKSIETKFATDMTGTRTRTFTSWFSIRTGETINKRDHIATHISTGVKSNIVTAVDVRVKSGNDNEILRKHTDKTAENFTIDEWSGDSKYWCKENCKKIHSLGGVGWFWPHKNFSGRYMKCGLFNKMSRALVNKDEKALKSYHLRSNSESTIHSKKAKLGDFVRSKDDTGKEQEEHLKWVNYNFSVLVRALYEWDIEPEFSL